MKVEIEMKPEDNIAAVPNATERTLRDLVTDLEARREHARQMGGPARIARQHAAGRQTARERIDMLIDSGSFAEIGLLAYPEHPKDEWGGADGFILGRARVDGRDVAIVAMDATTHQATAAFVNARKQMRHSWLSGRAGVPHIHLVEADGGRMPDITGWRFGALPLLFDQFPHPPQFHRAPRITVALGPCYGDASLNCVSADVIVMTETASIALGGPVVMANATGEKTTSSFLGGPESEGLARTAMVVSSEAEAMQMVKRYLSYFPNHAGEPAPRAEPRAPSTDPEAILDLVPMNPKRAYDVRKVLNAIVDADSITVFRPNFGKSLFTAFARIEGMPIALGASQPIARGGVVDAEAGEKLMAFADIADSFNLPLVILGDLPGALIGGDEERKGLLKTVFKGCEAMARLSVPKIFIVTRKSYGGGYVMLGGWPVRPDYIAAWPSAEISFMSSEFGIPTVYRKQLDEARASGGEEAYRSLLDLLKQDWANDTGPYAHAAHFWIDDVIDPRETRQVIVRAIEDSWGTFPRVTTVGLGEDASKRWRDY